MSYYDDSRGVQDSEKRKPKYNDAEQGYTNNLT